MPILGTTCRLAADWQGRLRDMKAKSLIGATVVGLAGVAVRDLTQKKHSLKRNFPVVANARYLLEKIGPELRQYIITGNDTERPFSRDQRSWVYASSKQENNYVGFGTDNDVEHLENYPIVKHRTFSAAAPSTAVAHGHHDESVDLPAAKVLGGPRGRRHAFRPGSVVNVSAMSFGSLSGNAIEAMNRGVALAGALHNTGEGGLSDHHRKGGDLVLQIGTAYFGCRDDQGRFDIDAPQGPRPERAGQGHRGQAEPGRQARPRWSPPRREDHRRDQPDPRHTQG